MNAKQDFAFWKARTRNPLLPWFRGKTRALAQRNCVPHLLALSKRFGTASLACSVCTPPRIHCWKRSRWQCRWPQVKFRQKIELAEHVEEKAVGQHIAFASAGFCRHSTNQNRTCWEGTPLQNYDEVFVCSLVEHSVNTGMTKHRPIGTAGPKLYDDPFPLPPVIFFLWVECNRNTCISWTLALCGCIAAFLHVGPCHAVHTETVLGLAFSLPRKKGNRDSLKKTPRSSLSRFLCFFLTCAHSFLQSYPLLPVFLEQHLSLNFFICLKMLCLNMFACFCLGDQTFAGMSASMSIHFGAQCCLLGCSMSSFAWPFALALTQALKLIIFE